MVSFYRRGLTHAKTNGMGSFVQRYLDFGTGTASQSPGPTTVVAGTGAHWRSLVSGRPGARFVGAAVVDRAEQPASPGGFSASGLAGQKSGLYFRT